VDLIHFDVGAAAVQFYLRIQQIWGNHSYRAVVSHTKKHTRGEQQLDPAICCLKHLAWLELGVAHRLLIQWLAAYRGRAFYIVNSPWNG
jgi:hypothetical protein